MESINKFLRIKSSIASNRLIKIDKELVPIRYLEDTPTEIYKSFIRIQPDSAFVSKSTFLKYLKLSKIYKKPCRLTDLCDYCEWAKKAKREFKSFVDEIENYDYSKEFTELF